MLNTTALFWKAMAAMDSGIVNTTWKYSQGRRCCCCASSQRAFANDWHFVQWRLRHELNEMRVWPQRSHFSTCPPRAAVRQHSMARMTRRCANRKAVRLAKGRAVTSEDVGHFQAGLCHGSYFDWMERR